MKVDGAAHLVSYDRFLHFGCLSFDSSPTVRVMFLCAFPFASVMEKTCIPTNHTVPWKHSPWTSSALNRRSRQATYMCCIVLIMGPVPEAGSAGRDRTPSCCLSFFT